MKQTLILKQPQNNNDNDLTKNLDNLNINLENKNIDIINNLSDLNQNLSTIENLNKNIELSSEEILKLKKTTEEKLESLKNSSSFAENQSLGEFGETNLNEANNQEVKIIKPLSESINKVGFDIKRYGSLITVLYLYNTISRHYVITLRKHSYNSDQLLKLSDVKRQELDQRWVKNITRFKLIFAPLIVASLFLIKNIIFNPKMIITLDIPKPELSNEDLPLNAQIKSFSFLVFFKKLPENIGKFVILLCIYKLINYILEKYSINIMDRYYINIYCIFVILVSSIFCLDYLFQYLITLFFKYNKNITISEKLPKKLFNYLSHLKFISENIYSFNQVFLINFLLYLFLLLMHIFILFLL